MSPLRVAVIGAGPIGMEAALEAGRRGWAVCVHDAGQVGEHLRRFGHVTLFTPFSMNSTPEGRERLRSAGVDLPPDEAHITAGDLVKRYLAPLARLPELRGVVREGERVTHVGRDALGKAGGDGSAGRSARPFLLRIEASGAAPRFDTADVVVDASGVYGQPNATGPGGLPATGEDDLGDSVERHLSGRLAGAQGDYARGTTLLVGDGHSAATALVALDALARNGASLRVHWIHRARPVVFHEVEHDPLPARLDLARRANRVATGAPWLTRHRGVRVLAYERRPDGRVRVTLGLPDDDPREELDSVSREARTLDVDRVLALVGYRPDLDITRELQVHHCYATEGPMKLAAAILASAAASPDAGGDCLAQVAHGPESLRNPEPGFYVLGAKSYGRNPQFLLSVGHQQVRDALALIERELPAGIAAPALSR